VCVGNVAPVSNPVDAALVLAHNRVANIGKLTVLKDEEVVLLGNGLQLVSYAGVPPVREEQGAKRQGDAREESNGGRGL